MLMNLLYVNESFIRMTYIVKRMKYSQSCAFDVNQVLNQWTWTELHGMSVIVTKILVI